MGQEFGQFIEWNFEQGLDFGLLEYEKHAQLHEFVKTLNNLYKRTPALWEIDYAWEGFNWLVSDDTDNSIIAFVRRDKAGEEIVCVCNFTPVDRENYTFGVVSEGVYEVIMNTDDTKFGGDGFGTKTRATSKPIAMHGYDNSISVNVAGLSAIFLKRKDKPKRVGESKKGKKSAEEAVIIQEVKQAAVETPVAKEKPVKKAPAKKAPAKKAEKVVEAPIEAPVVEAVVVEEKPVKKAPAKKAAAKKTKKATKKK